MKKFCFITSSYNSKKFITNNLDSIRYQKYSNYRIIYINDCSTDGTTELLEEYKKKYNYEKLEIIHNKKRIWPAHSRYKAYMKCHNNEICVLLDGDDWLITPHCLSILNNIYTTNTNILATFGSMRGEQWQYKRWDNYDRKKDNYFPHLRTVYAVVLKKIPIHYLQDSNKQWLHMCTDVALLTCVIELVGNKNYMFIKQELVHYNRYNSLHNKIEGYKINPNSIQRKKILEHIKNLIVLPKLYMY